MQSILEQNPDAGDEFAVIADFFPPYPAHLSPRHRWGDVTLNYDGGEMEQPHWLELQEAC